MLIILFYLTRKYSWPNLTQFQKYLGVHQEEGSCYIRWGLLHPVVEKKTSVGERETSVEKIAEETRKEKDLDRIRFNKAADQLINSSLPSLTSSTSVRALTLLNIDISFLSLPVDEWEANPAYQKGVSTVKNLSVTNDGAERGVAMISSYNDSLTKDEKTKQDLLQVSHVPIGTREESLIERSANTSWVVHQQTPSLVPRESV